MQNFGSIPEPSAKTRKPKEDIKKEIEDPVINSERHENKELEEKARKIKNSEDMAAVIRDFEEFIKSKKINIVWLGYQQEKVFEKFKAGA